jgi:hypothetical protein
MKQFKIVLGSFIISSTIVAQNIILFGANNDSAKQTVSKITVDKNLKGKFSFTKKWDYPVGIFKDENTGKFTTDGGPFDTTHLFYTANCFTNVQGGYDIRYCEATEENNKITLTFADDLPAYANEFKVNINTSSFWCEAKTIYPVRIKGEKLTCTIIKQKLIVDKVKCLKGDTIKGFIEMEFIEKVSIPNRAVQKSKYLLKGYFKTPLH